MMKAFLTGLVEVLRAETGAGETLAAVGSDHICMLVATKDLSGPIILIAPGSPYMTHAGQGKDYLNGTQRASVEIYADRGNRTTEEAMDAAFLLHPLVSRVLLNNQQLVCATYAGGVIKLGNEPLKIVSSEVIEDVEVPGSGGRRAFLVAISVEAEVSYDGQGLPVVS